MGIARAKRPTAMASVTAGIYHNTMMRKAQGVVRTASLGLLPATTIRGVSL
ncbi:MAG: hypothetical protein ACI4N3_01790 [Alphaproteobacteria bacterium]